MLRGLQGSNKMNIRVHQGRNTHSELYSMLQKPGVQEVKACQAEADLRGFSKMGCSKGTFGIHRACKGISGILRLKKNT